MLSRSSSNAGERLRRAQSTSSAHTTSSGHQRSATSIDPFVIRQHAETAAVEAFHRAKQYEEPAVLQAYRAVPPKLQRRRSQVTGKTEGSHFEDARLGRRRSTAKRDENREVTLDRSRHLTSEVPASDVNEGEVVITRKRSVIPPSSAPNYSLYDNSSAVSTNRSERRRSQAAYADGSPAPRNEALHQRNSIAHSPAPLSQRLQPNSPKPSIRETQTDDDILALAQSHCPAESQSKRLRDRKSLLLAPFQKRWVRHAHKENEGKFDTMLPPFNYAEEDLPPPPPIPPPPPPSYTVPVYSTSTEKKSRTISDSLKGRFKKVFRKATRLPTAIPAQHVEATYLHHPVITQLSTPTARLEEQEDPFTIGFGEDPLHPPLPDDTYHRQSSGEQSVAKSRVTSWTTSTAAGTWSTHHDVESVAAADEQGRLQRSDSASTLKKAKSFFGRPVKHKLRRASKLGLSNSDESAGLYSALQERIRPADSASQAAVSDAESQSVRTGSALDTLPSRQRGDSSISSRNGWLVSTIRSVTPDPTAYRLDIPSPVAEVMSPEVPRPRSRQEDSLDGSTPRSQLQRRPAIKAPTPSREQIEQRIERSKNRWQSPLDELSPSAPRTGRHMLEDNPYEMRSLSRTLQHPMSNDLPHHARVGEQQPDSGRLDVLSPSVYSRGADGESPRPDTPAAQSGMIVTITGREVKSYTISPSKLEQPSERPIHASQDWRRWLSDEMNGWDGSSAPQDFALSKTTTKEPASQTEAVPTKPSEKRASSASPAPDAALSQAKAKESRARPSSRLSSYMNERYPMIDTGRNSSDQSVGRRSRISSRQESRPATSESNARPQAVRERTSSGEGKTLKSALARQRVVTKPRSIAQLASSMDTEKAESPHEQTADAALAADAATQETPEAAKKALSERPAPTKRPKSAFDLRANYKSGTNSAAKPLEVRRKGFNNEGHNILEDTTIRNISAGPYACSPHEADKENIQPHAASEPAALPALSSSEWLAAGTNKKREGQGLSAVHPAYRNRSGSRYSPSRSGTGTPTSGLQVASGGGGGGSPGHRLATSWLDGKKGKEGSPAFV